MNVAELHLLTLQPHPVAQNRGMVMRFNNIDAIGCSAPGYSACCATPCAFGIQEESADKAKAGICYSIAVDGFGTIEANDKNR